MPNTVGRSRAFCGNMVFWRSILCKSAEKRDNLEYHVFSLSEISTQMLIFRKLENYTQGLKPNLSTSVSLVQMRKFAVI